MHYINKKYFSIIFKKLALLLIIVTFLTSLGISQDKEDKDPLAGIDLTSTSYLNVKDLEISALVKLVSRKTKRNYILDNTVRGQITIHQETPVDDKELIAILDSVLILKNFTSVKIGENLWKIIPARDAKQTNIPFYYTDDDSISTEAIITELIRLKHSSAQEVQRVISQFVSPNGIVNYAADTNSLIIIDTGSNIQRLREIIEQLDTPILDQKISIIRVLYADAEDVSSKVILILGLEDTNASYKQNSSPSRYPVRHLQTNNTNRDPNQPNSSNSSQNQQVLPAKVISDQRTNSLIVVADEATLIKIKDLVAQLDSEVDLSSGRFHVYRLQHADAEQLSAVLQAVISGANSNSLSEQNALKRQSSSIARPLSTGGSRMNPTNSQSSPDSGASKVTLEGDVTIAADTTTNSLVINASKADYEKLAEVIKILDSRRRQVLVEATIMEISLNDEFGLGTELQISGGGLDGGLFGQANYGGLTQLLSNPSSLSDLTIAAASAGTITLPGGLKIPSQAALITAVSKNANVKVLSSPNITATDNEEAEIVVGENVPFLASQSSSETNLNNTFNQIERQSVGIKLKITPQISTGDYVQLKIFVEISDVIPSTKNDPYGPTTTIRTTQTTVEVKNSQMVITGGLIAEGTTETLRGIPLLKDIPILGYLFKREDVRKTKTNLLIFITPRILGDPLDSRDATVRLADKVSKNIVGMKNVEDLETTLQSPEIDNIYTQTEDGKIHEKYDLKEYDYLSPDPEKLPETKRTLERINQLFKEESSDNKDNVEIKEEDDEINVEISTTLFNNGKINNSTR